MIPRTLQPVARQLARQYPIITITGPHQSGKTTLCRAAFPEMPYVNLERPDVREFANSDPLGFLAGYPEGAILDEIQRVPQLTSYLQPRVDERNAPGQYVLTGSQQFEVMTTITQSLAGRTALLKLLPLSMQELTAAGVEQTLDRQLLTGSIHVSMMQVSNPPRRSATMWRPMLSATSDNSLPSKTSGCSRNSCAYAPGASASYSISRA